MGWSITIGRVGGTAIRLHFTFLLFLIWIGVADYVASGPAAALATVIFILLVFLCVTLHEFGHIFMGRRFGVNTPEVILSPIGGIANMERIPEAPVQELLIAIAGPLVNVVIAILLMLGFGINMQQVFSSSLEGTGLAERLVLVNVMLVLFNLIPAFPMDGGRVLRALLSMRMGAPRATALAARIGQGFAFLFVLLGLFYNPILMLVGIFIYFAAAAEEQSAAFTGFASGLRVADAMEPTPVTLDETSPLSQAVDMLLATPQRDFPVLDRTSRVIGLLDREAMLAGLRDHGKDIAVSRVMRVAEPIRSDLSLAEAHAHMRAKGIKATVVTGGNGTLAGVLTLENIGEMMMVENAKPGWRFARRV